MADANRDQLLLAASQWRAYGATCALQPQRDMAEQAARSLERQAETGIAVDLNGKPYGRGLDIPGVSHG